MRRRPQQPRAARARQVYPADVGAPARVRRHASRSSATPRSHRRARFAGGEAEATRSTNERPMQRNGHWLLGTGGGVAPRLCGVRQGERESDSGSRDVILHRMPFLHVRRPLGGNRRRFHRDRVPFAWCTRFTSVPRLPPVLENVTLMARAAGARCPVHCGAPHGRAIVSTSRFQWVFQ
jgi:hypothetical protein